MDFDIVIVGGGAAGFFGAIQAALARPNLSILILERSGQLLSKVKVSGGGRCNVTHGEFDPGQLVQYYPRGEKELLGPFHTFCSGDTMAFFESQGVPLKIEEDGRVFPESDSSQSIIDCFIKMAQELGIQVSTNNGVLAIRSLGVTWELQTKSETIVAKKLLVASGSSPKMWDLLAGLGHTIIDPVPSLFTFNIKDRRIQDIPGVATETHIEVLGAGDEVLFEAGGPLLITHWGISGPAVLRLSAWGARILHGMNYQFRVRINWLPGHIGEMVLDMFKEEKANAGKRAVVNVVVGGIPKRLWFNLVRAAGIAEETTWAELTKIQGKALCQQLVACQFQVAGKSTFKEEFVSAGGVSLKEVNFKTFESKLFPNLYFAGEVLDIDAITGGFNFQNAWTGGYLAAQAMVDDL